MLIGAHAVHVTDDEIVLLARHSVRLTHCPLSNMRLASGIMRLGTIHAQGLRVGLGLDGGTNDTSDMFATMRAAVGLQRAVTRNPAVYPTVADALHLATLGGAEVLDMAGPDRLARAGQAGRYHCAQSADPQLCATL